MRPLIAARRSALVASLAAAILCAGCIKGPKSQRYSRQKLQETLARLESPGLVMGEFTLANHAVLDGDTLKVEGLDTTLRLLAIDTEEIFHHKDRRRAADVDFEQYLRDQRGNKPRPVKTGTPMGVEAMHFAEDFFSDVETVRLERDHPKEIRGHYNRYLTYVFARKNGQWVNYNLEAVRAGMSPYFTKYSYSRRFHDQFVAAQDEARKKKIGIWDPNKQHYRDYDERLAWWNARAEFIKKFEQDAQDRDDYIVLTHFDAIRLLGDKVGEEVTILATVGDIKLGDRGPTKVLLSRRLFNDFPVIFFDRDVFLSSGISRYKGEFVKVTGVVNIYKNKYTNKRQLQLLVNLPSQVVGSKVPGIDPTQPTAVMEQ